MPASKSNSFLARRQRGQQSRQFASSSSSSATLTCFNARSVGQQRRRARERDNRVARQCLNNNPTVASTSSFNTYSPGQRSRRVRERVEHNDLRRRAVVESTAAALPHSLPQQTQATDLFLAARGAYREPSARHDLGPMVVPCSHCGATHWMAEKLSNSSNQSPRFTSCCLEGKVRLPLLEPPPDTLRQLTTSTDRSAVKFRDLNWKYNLAFAFTSVGVQEDYSVPPVFRICGELYHNSGALLPDEGEIPRYAQIYVYEPLEALGHRMSNNLDLDAGIMEALQTMLNNCHQYVPLYRHAYEVLQQYGPISDVEIRLRLCEGLNPHTYNLPTADEVAVILPDNRSTHPRDVVLRLRSGPLQRISDLHPAYVPLQYPLLFPYGENGWYPEMRLFESEDEHRLRRERRVTRNQQRVDRGLNTADEPTMTSRRLTLSRYVAYRMHFRPQEFNMLLRGGRLFTRYVVDMFASINQQRLSWIENNQDMFRAARFNNLEDAAATDDENLDLNELGQRIFLPSSYIGGPRQMNQAFQDSMALARFFSKVDIFMTATTNPKWPEITRELLPGQTAFDRPDLVTRVFQLKKKVIVDYIYKHGVFGSAVAYVYTIEFQKRGLPHMHCLIFLEDPHKLQTPENIDSCIRAYWPDPETEPLLFETVKKHMVHGPCGALNHKAKCMVNGKCSKNYPKDFQPFTTMDNDGYPLYYRPDDGRTYMVNGHLIDNRWIVPHSPFFSALFDCHINVECATSLASFKYIFKYIQKGPDRALFEISEHDEVKRFKQGYYSTALNSAWRIFHFDLHEQMPNVVRLQVHLPGHHMVTFNADENLDTVLQRGTQQQTTLTAFFEANADTGPLGQEARKFTYQEFPQHFVYDEVQRKWKIRQCRFALGRMYFIKPTAGELFYLRTLLTVVKGPTSFADLRRVPGQELVEPTFYAACLARGLLEDDGEWRLCLQEACEIQTGKRLRHLFATLLLFAEPAHPGELWTEFQDLICDDLAHQLRAMHVLQPTEEDIYDYGLFLLDKILRDAGYSLENWPSMPRPQQNWATLTVNPLITEQQNYNRNAERNKYLDHVQQLNVDQHTAYECILSSITNDTGKTFFLNGPAGTGKTFVYNTTCSRVRSDGDIVLCVSSSGISALLLRGGRTAHSLFKIPVDSLHESSVCSISKQSQLADLLRVTKAIIWDEVSAQHRHAIEAVDRTLRDIRNIDKPFGGVTVVLGGDFLQTLPVVPKGSREDIINASIQCSYLWDDIEILHLRQNMRLETGSTDSRDFAHFGLNDVALYYIECTFAKFDPDRVESYPTKLSPPQYAFVGDVQKIVRLTDAHSISDKEADSSDFPVDACNQAYVHIAGVAANCDKNRGSFNLDVEHYISLAKTNHNNKIVAPVSCYIPDSPRWKIGKPVPYEKRYAFVTGLLSDISWDITSAEVAENRPVGRFVVTVDNIVFLGTQGGSTSAGNTLPNVLDNADPQMATKHGLISYKKRHHPDPSSQDSDSVNTVPEAEHVNTTKTSTSKSAENPATSASMSKTRSAHVSSAAAKEGPPEKIAKKN